MSVLDELRALYDDASPDTDHLDLDIPWARGKLVVRYQAPADRALLNNSLRSILSGTALKDDADLDLIALCCREILRRTDGQLEPLLDDGRPVRFDAEDKRLGDILGFTYPTAREAVRRTFRVDRNPAATLGHAERLAAFLQGIDDYVRGRVEGESNGASAAPSGTQNSSSSPA